MIPRVSVVIPTLDAAASLAGCLRCLDDAHEVVVIDGGSTDDTRRVARQNGARVVDSPPGRGGQLRAGAEAATGDWFLFLHADTLLGADWPAAVRRHVTSAPDAAGYFRFRLQSHAWQARLVELGVRLRGSLFKLPYGDQALFIRRDLYDRMGGFKPLPLFEDVNLVRRLGRTRLRLMHADAVTSAARWQQDGWLPRSARNLACLSLYLAGVKPERVAGIYRGGGRRRQSGAQA